MEVAEKIPLHGFLWDKLYFALIVMALAFMARGNPHLPFVCFTLYRSTDRRVASLLAMTLFLPASNHPTKIREEPKK